MVFRKGNIRTATAEMKRSKVAWIIDRHGWAQERRGHALAKHLPEFTFDIVTPRNQWLRKSCWQVRWNALFFASWRTAKKLMHLVEDGPSGCLAGVGSHYEIGPDLYSIPRGRNPMDVFGEAVQALKKFRYILINSERLWDLLRPHVGDAIYAPNGVDADYWHPNHKGFDPSQIRIGWIGAEKAAKNIYFLRQVEERLRWSPVKTDFIIRQRAHPTPYSQIEVRGLYRSWDFSLNVSYSEGCSNVLLESAACGVPGITVDVGDHNKLIREGETGFIVDPILDSVVSTIERLQHLQSWEYRRMAHAIREDIVNNWTWEQRAEPYRKALEVVCG